MSLKSCLLMLINEMYDDDDDEEICLVKFYSQFFHAINTKKRLRALCIKKAKP